ncbi:DNA-binding transcriptional LysR family regulator [Thermocatellispora tengchongensis]|uniref:DNA-binding transcriptional LysR family regulator n=1 Tax=Thermocatellispora tengchongensis TaxID=1073253 RepID=A0A840NYU7_9ACTN|nr:LysR family transcriptional regulator [Thermocatellispora tengchongensis]MBB5130873.1 DNA-binding transcriptional LysR family regulator [Thermocatellispora tengchongensis]
MTMNIAQLRAFVAVLDAGGFSAAADELGITQSAVSHAVAALERTLGGPVLTRHGRPRPTPFGEEVLPHARAAVAAASAIRAVAERRDGLPSGTVRLGAPPSVCQGLIPRLMSRWKAVHPRIDVAVFEGEDDEVADWLARGTVDLAVLVDPPSAGGVPLTRDAFHALLAADHPLAGEPEIGAADLEDDPFLLSTGGCERHVREVFRRAGVRFAPAHRIRELATLLAMVRTGVGVSMVPGLTRAMLTPGLAMVPLTERVTRRLVLTAPPTTPCHPAASALLEAQRQDTESGPELALTSQEQ